MRFDIKNRIIKRIDNDAEQPIGDNADYEAEFTFDNEWDGHIKTARFIQNSKYTEQILKDDKCLIPIEVLKQGYLKVGVFTSEMTTTSCETFIRASIKQENGITQEPTPDVYAQIIKMIENINVQVSDEQIEKAVAKYMAEHPITSPAIITLKNITATKEKTEYNVGDVFDSADIVVTANYSDGSSKDVTSSADIDTGNVNMNEVNTFNIPISYTENEITKTTSIDITVSAVTQDPAPTITVPQTGTWQLKTTTGKKYITISTDDDNVGNTAFFRLLRTYGFPYTMNVEAENVDKNIGTDDNGTFTDSDAESLFTNDITVKELGKYLTESGLGEVTQHGASAYNLWDSNNLTGTFLDELYESYTSQGGTRTKNELVAEIKLQLAASDVSQGAVYVEESRTIIENAIGYPIYALQTWGGSPVATVDGIECNLNSIKGGEYDYRGHNYVFASPRVGQVYKASHSLYDKTRNYYIVDIQTEIDKIAIGDIEDFFAHMPYNGLGDQALRQMLDIVKANVDAGIVEVVTPSQYYNLGEWVDNPVTEIKLTRNSNIALGETDDITAYTVIATYEDGSTTDVTEEAIVNNSAINVDEIGNYTVLATYRGFNATATVSVIDTSYTIPEGLKDKDYWFIFKDDTMDMYFAGNTTGTFGDATTSAGRLTFTGCAPGKINGWKSADGQTWEQTDVDETHYATIKTTSGTGIFDFEIGVSDTITWLETSGNFILKY